jgi:hypothetical protein
MQMLRQMHIRILDFGFWISDFGFRLWCFVNQCFFSPLKIIRADPDLGKPGGASLVSSAVRFDRATV